MRRAGPRSPGYSARSRPLLRADNGRARRSPNPWTSASGSPAKPSTRPCGARSPAPGKPASAPPMPRSNGSARNEPAGYTAPSAASADPLQSETGSCSPGTRGRRRPAVEPIHLAGIFRKNLALLLLAQPGDCIDVALGIVEIMSRLRIDAAHRADHLGSEQNIVRGHDFEQQLDPRQMVDARIEEHVAEQQFRKRRPLHVLGEAAIPAPMVR